MNTKLTGTTKKVQLVGAKLSVRVKALIATISVGMTSALCSFNAYAAGGGLNIDTNYSVNTNVASTNPEGLIIGLAVWVCRLIGIGMLIWGIYGYVTARKDGEAEAMNGAIGKLVAGLVLICMPAVLRGLNIIA